MNYQQLTAPKEFRLFGECRQDALDLWLKESNRDIDDDVECYENSKPCIWQEQHGIRDGMQHNSQFCCIADSACHITDALTDYRLDNVPFASGWDQRQAISRFYERFCEIVYNYSAFSISVRADTNLLLSWEKTMMQ